MKRAAIYTRVSTQNQEQEGTSLESQEVACRKYAQEYGYQVDDYYVISEVYSGLKLLERPGINQVRNWVRDSEVDGVVIYSTDRLSRDPLHLLLVVEEFDKKGIQLHFITEPLDNSMEGQLLGYVRGWASKLEAAKICERTMRGKKTHAIAGNIPSGFGRYGGYLGLCYDKDEKKLVHTDQIGTAERILKDYLNGKSSSEITKELQADGVCGLGGNLICRSSVNAVLTHAHVYAGTVFWKEYQLQNKVEPIITE